MPDFSDNKDNLSNDSSSQDNNTDSHNNDNQENGVSLFDLTKDSETKNVGLVGKNTQIANQSPKNNNPSAIPRSNQNEIRNIYPTPKNDLEEELPIDRQTAQLQRKPDILKSGEDNQAQKISEHPTSSQPENTTNIQPKNSKLKLFLKIILFTVGSFIFVYLFLNFPALWAKLSYYFKEKTGEKPQIQTIIPADTNEDLLFLSTVTLYDTPEQNNNEVKRGPTKDELGLRGIENNELWIPKIDVEAPIIWDSPVDEATMMENLKHGVVHYKGTTKPGETAQDGEGNIFISGHSSYYWWDDGQFKTVFANLDQLDVGDEIGIGYDDYGYVYRVYDKQIVDPTDVSVLAQNTDKPTLSLMTCYPVGTNNKRLIVKAELVGRGKDEPEIIEEKTVEENSTPVVSPTPTPVVISSPSSAPNSSSKNFDVLDILPWNW